MPLAQADPGQPQPQPQTPQPQAPQPQAPQPQAPQPQAPGSAPWQQGAGVPGQPAAAAPPAQSAAPTQAPWGESAPPPFVSGAAAATGAQESTPPGGSAFPTPPPVFTLPTQVDPAVADAQATPWSANTIPEYKPAEGGAAIPEGVKLGGFADDEPPNSRTTKILLGSVALLLIGAFFAFNGMPKSEKKAKATTTTKMGQAATKECQTTGDGDVATCIVGLPTVTYDPPNDWKAAPAELPGGGSGATFTSPDGFQAISVVGAPTNAIVKDLANQPRSNATTTELKSGIAYRTTRAGSTLPLYVVEGKNGTVVVEMTKAPNQNGTDPVAVKNFDQVVASLSAVP